MTYQPQLKKNKPIIVGRDCEERWNIIKNLLPQRGIVFDIGSSAGFYGVKSMLQSKDLYVLSLEASDYESSVQRGILASYSFRQVCLLNGMLSEDFAHTWSQSEDVIDVSLVLSVIHWFKNPADILRSISRISRRTIVEILHHRDSGACGQAFVSSIESPLEWVQKSTDFPAKVVGRAERHTSDYPSYLILVENDLIPSTRDSKIDLKNMMSLGRLMWPPPRYWQSEAVKLRNLREEAVLPLQKRIFWTGESLLQEGDARQEMIWDVGGSRELMGSERLKVNSVNMKYEMRFFSRIIAAWVANETVLPNCAVGRRLFLDRVSFASLSWFKRFLRKVVGDAAYDGLRVKLRALLTRKK